MALEIIIYSKSSMRGKKWNNDCRITELCGLGLCVWFPIMQLCVSLECVELCMWAAAVWDSRPLCVLTGADLTVTRLPSQHMASAGQLGPNYPQAVSHTHTCTQTHFMYRAHFYWETILFSQFYCVWERVSLYLLSPPSFCLWWTFCEMERARRELFSTARKRRCHALRNHHVWIRLLSDLSSAVLIPDPGVDSEAH